MHYLYPYQIKISRLRSRTTEISALGSAEDEAFDVLRDGTAFETFFLHNDYQ